MNLKVSGINIGYGDAGFIKSESVTKVWADDVCNAKTWAFFIRFSFGIWLRPIKKFWTKDNAWVSGNHWFVLNSRVRIPGFFISFFFKGIYFYIGTKTYGVDWFDYCGWINFKYIKEGNRAMAPSMSIRTS